MTKFDKALINKDGEYITYGPDRKFIARFKYSRGPFTKAKFIKELIANHDVDDYFNAIDFGFAPIAILRDKNPDWYFGLLEAYSGKSFR